LWRISDQGWVIKTYGTTTNLPRGLPTKTHGPGKEGINQRGNNEIKDNPDGAAKLPMEIEVSVHRTTF
jgi:hypothetical protein